MKSVRVNFSCGNITLEGIFTLPEANRSMPGVVVCHPHPLYGGSMNNNVVNAVVSSLTQRNIATLKFNFRGTGGSTGVHDYGKGEKEDIIAALDFMSKQPEVDNQRLGLTGYSFGAMVAANVALIETRVRALVLISPAMSQPELSKLARLSQPCLIISGDLDDFVSSAAINGLKNCLPKTAVTEIITSADHFWWGKERELAEKVADFLSYHLTPSQHP